MCTDKLTHVQMTSSVIMRRGIQQWEKNKCWIWMHRETLIWILNAKTQLKFSLLIRAVHAFLCMKFWRSEPDVCSLCCTIFNLNVNFLIHFCIHSFVVSLFRCNTKFRCWYCCRFSSIQRSSVVLFVWQNSRLAKMNSSTNNRSENYIHYWLNRFPIQPRTLHTCTKHLPVSLLARFVYVAAAQQPSGIIFHFKVKICSSTMWLSSLASFPASRVAGGGWSCNHLPCLWLEIDAPFAMSFCRRVEIMWADWRPNASEISNSPRVWLFFGVFQYLIAFTVI